MRIILGVGLVLAPLATGGNALAARHHHHVASRAVAISGGSHCAPPVIHSEAFDVTGLKSELMVTALSCNEQDKYNAFVAKFHPELIAEEASLDGYFSRTYGRSAQKAHDDYITLLANVQADEGLRSGVAFCQQRMSMFDEVAVLDNATDLSEYAHGKDIVQPADEGGCAASPSAAGHHVRPRRISARSVAHHR